MELFLVKQLEPDHPLHEERVIISLEGLFENNLQKDEVDSAENNAEACRAKGLVHHELLSDAGVSMDDFMADALAEKFYDIERIDRLTAVVESRRNACLHVIDRRRAALAKRCDGARRRSKTSK